MQVNFDRLGSRICPTALVGVNYYAVSLNLRAVSEPEQGVKGGVCLNAKVYSVSHCLRDSNYVGANVISSIDNYPINSATNP